MYNKRNCNNQTENAAFGFNFDQLGKTIEEFLGKNNVNEFWGHDFAHKTPLVNVYDSPEGLSIELAAPGLSKEAFSVSVEQNTLIISANKNVKESADNVKIKRKEFEYSTFSKTFRLSNKYDTEKITARYENGILQIHVAIKTAEKKESYKIEIF
jgi:HSP20 family protein